MNYADIKDIDVANGPGVRVSLFVSGCTHNCKGCFNKEAQDFNYGKIFTDKQIDEIIEYMRPNHIRGLTILGGEPFEKQNQAEVLKVVQRVRAEFGGTKSIWAFSGYLFDEDMLYGELSKCESTKQILEHIDILVDGEFMENYKDLKLKFRGSSNQRQILVQESFKANKIVLWK